MSEDTTTRRQVGIDDAVRLLTGASVVSVEFVEGETEDEDYAVLTFANGVTFYASVPSVYANPGSGSGFVPPDDLADACRANGK